MAEPIAVDRSLEMFDIPSSFQSINISDLLCLRTMVSADIEGFHKYRSNSNVARYQSWDDTFSEEDARLFVMKQINAIPNIPGSWIQIAIANRETNDIVGDVAFSSEFHQPEVVHVGVTISPNVQNTGVGFQALSTLLHYLFITLGKLRVVATIDALNVASIALFRKLKFRQEAHFVENVFFKGAWGSEVQFALLRREYVANKDIV